MKCEGDTLLSRKGAVPAKAGKEFTVKGSEPADLQ